MIQFENEKYGKVIIYEIEEVWRKGCFLLSSENLTLSEFNIMKLRKLSEAGLVGFRDIKKRKTIVIKNRYAPLEDYKTEQFILNYKLKEDIPIYSRFEILDL